MPMPPRKYDGETNFGFTGRERKSEMILAIKSKELRNWLLRLFLFLVLKSEFFQPNQGGNVTTESSNNCTPAVK